MRATTHSMSREARRRIKKSRFNGLPPTVPTFYFLQDASILRMDRLRMSRQLPQVLREIADPQGTAV